MSPPVLSLIAAFLFAIAYGWTWNFEDRTSPSAVQRAAVPSLSAGISEITAQPPSQNCHRGLVRIASPTRCGLRAVDLPLSIRSRIVF